MKGLKMMVKSCIIILITVIVDVSVGFCVRGFIGAIYGMLLSICISVPFVIALCVLDRYVASKRFFRQITYVLLLLSIATVIIHIKNQWAPSSSQLFQRTVAKPIPKSVSNIYSAMDYLAMDHMYRLRFKINDSDLSEIISQKKFQLFEENTNAADDTHLKKVFWWDPKYISSLKLYVAQYEYNPKHYMWVDADNNIVYYLKFK